MATVGVNSPSPFLDPIKGSAPIIKGEISKIKNKQLLTVVDNQNEILFTGEIKEKKGFTDRFSNMRKITVIDPNTNRSKQVYLKVKTIALRGGLKPDYKKKITQDALFNFANSHQEKVAKELNDRLPPKAVKENSNKASDQRKTINQKVELFKKVNISVPKSEIVLDEEGNEDKIRNNIPLTESQMRQLATEIEVNKSKWLEEADENGFWIKKEVSLEGLDTPVSVEIYPSDRKEKESLGRIDIQMHYIARGSAKKVYRSLNYETGKTYIGAYAKGPTVKGQIATESRFKAGFQALKGSGGENVKKKLLISKDYDARIKMKKDGTAINHVKFTQKEMVGSMGDVLVDMVMPDGTPLTDEMKTKFMISALESLEQIHSMNMIHVDIKPDNILRDPEKAGDPDSQFKLRLVDYDLSLEKGAEHKNVRGTPFYIAPEVLLQMVDYKEGTNIVYSESNDMYSLGTSFAGGDIDPWWDPDTGYPDLETLKAFKELDATPADEPPDKNTFEWGVWKMTHFDPAMRFQSATEAKEFFKSLTF